MDYPDTDEMNFAKDDKDLTEYFAYHEMPFQDVDQRGITTEEQNIDHQGMMTEEHDLLDNSENKNKDITRNKLDLEIKVENLKEIHKKSHKIENLNMSDSRETPTGFI